MRVFKHLIASVSFVSLAACPAPPDSGGQQGGPPGGAPGGAPGMVQPGPEGPGAPGQANNNAREDNKQPGGEAVTDTAGIPSFSALIDSGVETVTLSGKVPGVNKGQVDVQIAHKINDWTVPRIVHQGKVTNGAFSFDVPKKFTQPIYLVVLNDKNGNGPDPTDQMIYYPETVNLGVEDVSLEFSDGGEPEWVKTVFSQLPDPENAPNLIKDGEPPGGSDLPTPTNPPPDGIENYPPGDMPLGPATRPEDDTPAPPPEEQAP